MANASILVVDDNPANTKLLAFVLSNHGYVVRTAADAVETMNVLTTFMPRLVLMDIQLPGVDGLELTRRLKGNPSTRDVIVVALTAYAMKGDEERARAAGCDAYVTKPINTRTLPGLIATLLERGSE